MASLFDPLPLRAVTLANRMVVSPMCQYSADDGLANDWHFVHLASRAVGGAGLVLTEATAVAPEGRITPRDLGLYRDDQIGGLARIVRFLHTQATRAGIQLAHAGRKGSTGRPWERPTAVAPHDGGWETASPTNRPFAEGYPRPRAMTGAEIGRLVEAFRAAAVRAIEAGFDVIELHAAHGYLVHQFLSPLVNDRTDDYGGSFDNRVRLCLQVVEAIRSVWPDRLPLVVRLSATDWVEGGWDIEQSIELVRRLRARGVDLIDCSSAGAVPNVQVPLGPGYQVPFAERIRQETGAPTGAVGLITTPLQADAIVRAERADCVLLGRQMLRDPYFPLRAARELGQSVPWPVQYLRSAPPGAVGR